MRVRSFGAFVWCEECSRANTSVLSCEHSAYNCIPIEPSLSDESTDFCSLTDILSLPLSIASRFAPRFLPHVGCLFLRLNSFVYLSLSRDVRHSSKLVKGKFFRCRGGTIVHLLDSIRLLSFSTRSARTEREANSCEFFFRSVSFNFSFISFCIFSCISYLQ